MRLEHLRVVEDDACNLNDLITDAFEELPNEDKAIIYNDYTTVNNYAPIYLNTEENLNRLLSEGKKCTPSFNKDFAFLTCNRYGGIESVDDLSKHADLKEEIVPFVSDSFDKYADVFLKDVDIDKAWLERHLPRSGMITRRQYVNRVEDIANVVRYENEELAEKVHEIANKIRKTGKAYKLSEASEELKDLFAKYYEGTGKKERGKPLEGEELKKAKNMIWEKYQENYPDTEEYDDLPDDVKNLYKKFFFENSVKGLQRFLNSQLGLGAVSNSEALHKERDWGLIMEDYPKLLSEFRDNPKTAQFVKSYVNELKKEFYQGRRDEKTTRAFLKLILAKAKKMSREIKISENVKKAVIEKWKGLGEEFINAREKDLMDRTENVTSSKAAEDISNAYNAVLITFFDRLNSSVKEIAEDTGETEDDVVKHINEYLAEQQKGNTLNSFINTVNKNQGLSTNFYKVNILGIDLEKLKEEKLDEDEDEEESKSEQEKKPDDKTPPSAQGAEEEKKESSEQKQSNNSSSENQKVDESEGMFSIVG